MAAPLIVSFWMRAAFTLVDTYFAGRIGDSAVAAVGLSLPFEFIGIAIWVGLSTGLTSGLARAMGAREGANIESYQRAARRQILCVIPVYCSIGVAIGLGAFDAGLAPDVARDFRTYGGVLIFGMGCTVFWSVLPDSIVKAHQDMRSTMWAGIVSNLGNVCLNALFLFGFGWGVFGLALATGLSRLGGLAYALRAARRHEDARKARGLDTAPHVEPRPHRAMLALAIPSAAAFMLMAAENGLVNLLLARLPDAKAQLAAFSVFNRLTTFAFQPTIAVAIAMLPFASLRFGRRDFDGMRAGLKEALRAIVGYVALVVAPIIWVFAPAIVSGFTAEEATRAAAVDALRLAPIACLCGAPFALCRPLFEGMRRGGPGLVMAVARYLGLSGPGALLGLWLAPRLGVAPVAGAIGGLIAVAALSSLAFAAWARHALAAEEREARAGR